jgi:hypothetical protein
MENPAALGNFARRRSGDIVGLRLRIGPMATSGAVRPLLGPDQTTMPDDHATDVA